jgi:hypothetical protein
MDKEDPLFKKFIEQIEKLEYKAELQRHIQSVLATKYQHIINAISVITVIFTILIAFLSIVIPIVWQLNDTGQICFSVFIAFLSIIVLFLSVADRIFSLNTKYSLYENGVKVFTTFIRDTHAYRHIGILRDTPEIVAEKIEQFKKDYSNINENLPISHLKTKEFLKLKQDHLIKIEISRKLSENPHLNIDNELKRRS